MEYFVIGFLGGGFIGMVGSFSLLSEIYDPVSEGWERIGVIAFALLLVGWWGGLIWLIWLIAKYSA